MDQNVTQRHKVSKCCWKNGPDRLARRGAAPNLPFVKKNKNKTKKYPKPPKNPQHLQSTIHWDAVQRGLPALVKEKKQIHLVVWSHSPGESTSARPRGSECGCFLTCFLRCHLWCRVAPGRPPLRGGGLLEERLRGVHSRCVSWSWCRAILRMLSGYSLLFRKNAPHSGHVLGRHPPV